MSNRFEPARHRNAPANISTAEFREVGYHLVDRISEFFESLPQRTITPAESPNTVRRLIGGNGLPSAGTTASMRCAGREPTRPVRCSATSSLVCCETW